MRKAAKQIICSAVLLTVLCIVCRFLFFHAFNLYIPAIYVLGDGEDLTALHMESENPEIMQPGEPEIYGDYIRVPVKVFSAGKTAIIIYDRDRKSYNMSVLSADMFRSVYNYGNGNFTGDSAVLFAVTLFWGLVSFIMLWHFFQMKGADFYSYSTVYYAGFSLFALVSAVVMLQVTFFHLIQPESFSMITAYSRISGAGTQFMLISMPVMLVFAAAMAVSNIVLLKRVRPRIQNVLGLLIAVLLVAGEALGLYLSSRDLMGSEWEIRLNDTLVNTYATAFIYFQCMLTGAVICGLTAARRRPAMDRDFIIVLGCWFRPDGTLPPLLRGRADAAIDFWKKQKAETGKEAVFIPSGGQGNNEPESEAEAIRRYLLEQGIEDRLILPEKASHTTLENMAFSKKIIGDTNPEGMAAFATSSYHVFRSGVWARQEGLKAEGIGGKTKWWFWPNAFMRETAGLLAKRWKQEILLLVLLAAFFGALSLIL